MVYTVHRVLFYAQQNCADKGHLVNVPFRNWVKLSDALATRAKHRYHAHSMQDADILKGNH